MKAHLQECLAAAIALGIFAGFGWIMTKIADVDWLTAFTIVSVFCLSAQQMRESRRGPQ